MGVELVSKDELKSIDRDKRTIYFVKDDKSVYVGKDPHKFKMVLADKNSVDNRGREC